MLWEGWKCDGQWGQCGKVESRGEGKALLWKGHPSVLWTMQYADWFSVATPSLRTSPLSSKVGEDAASLGTEALAACISVSFSPWAIRPPNVSLMTEIHWREFPGSRVFQAELQIGELHTSSFYFRSCSQWSVRPVSSLWWVQFRLELWSEFSSTWPMFLGQWCCLLFLCELVRSIHKARARRELAPRAVQVWSRTALPSGNVSHICYFKCSSSHTKKVKKKKNPKNRTN